jgi:hypothetical protein
MVGLGGDLWRCERTVATKAASNATFHSFESHEMDGFPTLFLAASLPSDNVYVIKVSYGKIRLGI